MGRRNITDEHKVYLRGLLYNQEKGRHGGNRNSKAETPLLKKNTAEAIAEKFDVNHDTIKADGKFAEVVDAVGTVSQDLKNEILNGNIKVSKTTAEKVVKAGKAEEFAEALKEHRDEKKALEALLPIRTQASMEFEEPEPTPTENEDFFIEEFSPEERETLEKIRAILPALATAFEDNELVWEGLSVYEKVFAYPEELQLAFLGTLFTTGNSTEAWKVLHAHRQQTEQETPQDQEPTTTPETESKPKKPPFYMASLRKMVQKGLTVVQIEGNKILSFAVDKDSMFWQESEQYTFKSNAEAKRELERLFEKYDNLVIANY